MKRHGRPVDTTANEGYGVCLGRPLGTTKGVVLVRETCEYHSRGEEYGVIWRDLWVPQQTGPRRDMVLARERPVSTANNLSRVIK